MSTTSTSNTQTPSGIPTSADQWVKTLAISKGIPRLGFEDDFLQTVNLPQDDITQLSPAELAVLMENTYKSYDLYKDTKMTELRGDISKQLAQMNHMTERMKARNQFAISQNEAAASYRNTLRNSLAATLQGL